MTITKKSFNDNLPLIAFGGLTLIGALLVAAAKMTGVPPIITTTIPIVLMFVYLWASIYLRKIQLHDEQTGDNLYYMGFLFTLTSLGVSLYQFTADGSMDDVVRNFGIAITSTIVGIALRIMFNQTRRDVQDIERATRHDLATMARIVRGEMEAARLEFAEYRRINSQMINEGFYEILENTSTISSKLAHSIDEMVKQTLKPLEDVSKHFEINLSNSIAEISKKLKNASTSLDETTTKMKAAADRMSEIQKPSEVIKNDLNLILKEMGSLMTDLVTKVEQVSKEQGKTISEVAVHFKEAQAEQNKASFDAKEILSQLVDQAKNSINQMSQLIEASKDAVTKTEDIAEKFNDNIKRTELIEKNVDSTVAEIRSIKDIMNNILSKILFKSGG